MRIRTGHKPEDWTENIESYARIPGVRGSSIESTPSVRVRAVESQLRYKAKLAAEKADAA